MPGEDGNELVLKKKRGAKGAEKVVMVQVYTKGFNGKFQHEHLQALSRISNGSPLVQFGCRKKKEWLFGREGAAMVWVTAACECCKCREVFERDVMLRSYGKSRGGELVVAGLDAGRKGKV